MAAEKAHIDFGLYAVLGEESIEHVPALIEAGVIGFKLYMGNTFGKIPSPSTGAMLEAFEVVAPTGKRISLHAETNSIMERRETRLRAAGRTDPLAHLASRPAVVAIEAVSRAAILAEWTGARIHILHISSADELRPLREAKARGVDITGETCPHYLMLSADDYARFAGVIRVNPPVREARNQEPLWAALADGTVDLIATDHAPHSREEKTRNDIWTVDCGFPGVETQMPLMLTRSERRPHDDHGLRGDVGREAGEDLRPLSAQGRHRAGRRGRHRGGRSEARDDDRRRQTAIARQDHAVARPQGEGSADPHAGARPLRDARPHARRRHARPRPLGAHHPAMPAARAAQHRSNDDSPSPACRRGQPRAPHERGRFRQARERRRSLMAARPSIRSHALDETNLRIGQGDFIALVGPSGCGKSTILKLVGGLIRASSGYVYVAGRELGAEPIRIGMAFQNPTMLPWLTIRDNVMLPLKIVPPFRQEYRAKRHTEFKDRAEALLAQVGLKGFGDKYPWQLSGGMLQRASLCRALVHDPQLLLLDEPFGALDQFTREELWAIMQELWITRKPTVILVTHDLREAGYLANRIAVMRARPGRIIDDSVVPFARPRTMDMIYDPTFVTLTQRLRELIVEVRGDNVPQAPQPRRPRHEQQLGRHLASTAFIVGLFLLWEVALPRLPCQRRDPAAPKPGVRHAVAARAGALAAHACRRSTRPWSASFSALRSASSSA